MVTSRLNRTTLLKATLAHGYFSRFLNCANSSKLREVSHIVLGVSRNFSEQSFLRLRPDDCFILNPLSANSTKWSSTLK